MPVSQTSVWLNRLAPALYWFCVWGEFYYGFKYALPSVYANTSDPHFWVTLNHALCYVMFGEMMVNWACIRLCRSPWKPDDHTAELNDMGGAVNDPGYEFDIDRLEHSGQQPGLFSLDTRTMTSGSDGSGVRRRPAGGHLTVVSMTTGDDGVRRGVAYPYYSWQPCGACACRRPPRAHHCPLCGECVLKRDHHCYFAGVCVGLRNQRHFIVFNFWAVVAILYSELHIVAYVVTDFCVRNSWFDLFLPFTVGRCIMGYLSVSDLGFVLIIYSLTWFLVTSAGFLTEQINCVRLGVTSHEVDSGIRIKDCRSLDGKLRGIFGDYYLWNIFLPCHFVFPTKDDGFQWPSVNAY